jgi:hypothetical protein
MSPENGTGLPFDLRGYVELTPTMTYANTTATGYQEMSFRLSNQPKFRVFAIKIVMASTKSSTVVPRFRNLRITASQLSYQQVKGENGIVRDTESRALLFTNREE